MTSAPAKTEDVIDDDERKCSNTGKPSAQRCKKRKRKVETSFTDFPGPNCHVGNLNMEGLLRHMLRLPEANHSTFRAGHMSTRFCCHTEDASLNSVSYLHRRSTDKIWFANLRNTQRPSTRMLPRMFSMVGWPRSGLLHRDF